ncbi:MAG TPA: exodeoxyribonuclease III [Beijerinckiaceae bacterium]|nr:exodeoxyribonuclease III [Beijerinckiaceae bacterium]
MTLTIATWNINSVRLRLDLVLRYLSEAAPDVLCLQETKCPDAEFPRSAFVKAGYPHILHRGMKGYNGVAILSRLPLAAAENLTLCGREDARHIAAEVRPADGPSLLVHNFYVPAGGDIPDRIENPKFGHKLDFLAEMTDWAERLRARHDRAVLVGDLNIAPLVHDVWSHKALLKVVSHTPIECEALLHLQDSGGWIDAVRCLNPEPEKVYTWWSYRSPDWNAADKGRRLDHIWVGPALKPAIASSSILRAARGWERPSDHVPLAVTLAL